MAALAERWLPPMVLEDRVGDRALMDLRTFAMIPQAEWVMFDLFGVAVVVWAKRFMPNAEVTEERPPRVVHAPAKAGRARIRLLRGDARAPLPRNRSGSKWPARSMSSTSMSRASPGARCRSPRLIATRRR